jgi:hypothetical protein
VFTLLETIFTAFDSLAKKRQVFKVETVGDCYVAVSGLPQARKDHAVVMARFAHECLSKMHSLSHLLEVSLGPDTAELTLRVGLHSGPVTAGVLRGDRSRFQLFGDTMNTASRMESTGIRDKIQVSKYTADLLIAAGKKEWLVPREDVVIAKGKGEMRTFWLNKGGSKSGTSKSSESDVCSATQPTQFFVDEFDNPEQASKTHRLIKWNVEILFNLLKQIEASRSFCEYDPISLSANSGTMKSVLDEVQEIISMPGFAAKQIRNPLTIELDAKVEDELLQYV